MKNFRLITISIIATILLLFVCNIFFITRIYDSIKERYMSDVEQCLLRADQIEIVERLVSAGFGDTGGIIPVWVGLQKSDVGAAATPEELKSLNYSQGYKRVDRQLVSIITKYLHDTYDDVASDHDRDNLEQAFRRELNFSGYFPKEVIILGEGDCAEFSGDLWQLEHRVDGDLIYEAYITPLTKSILIEMRGLIITTALIGIVLAFAFIYLLHVIGHQKTLDEMKDDFTNNMTHELKTPIAIAYAANDALLQFPDPKDEERTRRYLTVALTELSKLTGLVETILAMSMERRRNLTMSKEKIRLRPFIETVVEQQRLRGGKEAEISVSCQEETTIEADPIHFSNILNNLIDNALKYSGKKVKIEISADQNSISISDNGIGIPAKYLPLIFQKFYRVPQGKLHEEGGYGIGLFYVKSIVDKHCWHIYVNSKPGYGSTFTIKFS